METLVKKLLRVILFCQVSKDYIIKDIFFALADYLVAVTDFKIL